MTAREVFALLRPEDLVKLDRASESGGAAPGVIFTDVFRRIGPSTGGTKLRDSHGDRAVDVAHQARGHVVAEGFTTYGMGVRDVALAHHGGDVYRLYFGGRGKYVYVVEFASDES